MNASIRSVPALAGLLALSLVGSLAAHAGEESATATRMCHQETRRVAVWPTNPKLQQIPRFETRTVMVCDHQEAAAKKPPRTASPPTYGPRQR